MRKENQEKAAAALRNAQNKTQADSKRDIQIGDTVRIKGDLKEREMYGIRAASLNSFSRLAKTHASLSIR